MKQLLTTNYQLSIVAILFFAVGCREVGPNINLRNNANAVSDTSYIEAPVAMPEAKNMLIEEFTGVNCPNCPKAHVIIADLKTANPGRVSSVSYHPINSFGALRPTSVVDLRSDEATSLLTNYFSWPGFEPIGSINRKLFGGESNLLLDRSKWAAKVTSELAATTPINLILEQTYDTATRELTIVTELHYTQNVAEENKLTILLMESDIVTTQLDGSVDIVSYVHKDVFRTFVSSLEGDVVNAPSREAGRVVRKIYKKTLDAAWNAEHMHILAFVHQFNTVRDVYQAKEIDVQ